MTEDYRDHLIGARERIAEGDPERAEDALMWAAASALCAIADSLATIGTAVCAIAEPLSTVEATDRTDGLPDVAKDGQGDVWRRVGGTDRYAALGISVGRTLAEIREQWGFADDQRVPAAPVDEERYPEEWVDSGGVVWLRGPVSVDGEPAYTLAGGNATQYFSLKYLKSLN